jgi:hypothetical protein
VIVEADNKFHLSQPPELFRRVDELGVGDFSDSVFTTTLGKADQLGSKEFHLAHELRIGMLRD